MRIINFCYIRILLCLASFPAQTFTKISVVCVTISSWLKKLFYNIYPQTMYLAIALRLTYACEQYFNNNKFTLYL